MQYIYVKIFINGVINNVKVFKHDKEWEYRDFLLSTSAHANISLLNIDYFADHRDVKIDEDYFIEYVFQLNNLPQFVLKVVMKNYNALSNTSPRSVTINAQDLEIYILKTPNASVLCKKVSEYEPVRRLSVTERRTIIRESVNYLKSLLLIRIDPFEITELALAVEKLFPQLKYNKENDGIDAFHARKMGVNLIEVNIIARLNRLRMKANEATEEQEAKMMGRNWNANESSSSSDRNYFID